MFVLKKRFNEKSLDLKEKKLKCQNIPPSWELKHNFALTWHLNKLHTGDIRTVKISKNILSWSFVASSSDNWTLRECVYVLMISNSLAGASFFSHHWSPVSVFMLSFSESPWHSCPHPDKGSTITTHISSLTFIKTAHACRHLTFTCREYIF